VTRILVQCGSNFWYVNTTLLRTRAEIFAEALEVAYLRMAAGELAVEITMDDGGSRTYRLRSQ